MDFRGALLALQMVVFLFISLLAMQTGAFEVRESRLHLTGVGRKLSAMRMVTTPVSSNADAQGEGGYRNSKKRPPSNSNSNINSNSNSASGYARGGGNSYSRNQERQNHYQNKDAPSQPEPVLLQQLGELADKGDHVGYANRLKTIASKQATVYSQDFSNQLSHQMRSLAPKLSAATATDCLWSVGKLGFRFHVRDHREVALSMLAVLCNSGLAEDEGVPSARQVTTSLGGLARMGMKWPLLPQSEKSHPGLGLLQPATAESALMRKDSVERSGHLQVALIEVMGRVSADLNDREICNLLHSLSKMGVPWAAFPQTIQNGLLASFQRESRKLTGQQGSMTVYSFGLVGMNINRVPPAVRDNIFVVSMGVLDEALAFDKARLRTTEGRYIIQQTSNVIYGLAKQSANYYSLPQSMREKVSQAVVWCMGAMNEQEVSNTIYSHGVMGAVWDDLGEELHDVFRSSATRCLGNMITQGVSNTLYGMGLMQARWHDMGIDYTYAVLEAVIRVFKTPEGSHIQRPGGRAGRDSPIGPYPQAVANVIYSLGVSGAVWDEFPLQMQHTLQQGLQAIGTELNSQEISNIVYGLGLLRAEYHDLPTELTNELTYNLERVATQNRDMLNEQEVCATLHGFAKMNARWPDLSEELRQVILGCVDNLAEMGVLCLACSMYSLGVLGAQWSRLPHKTRALLLNASTKTRLVDQSIANIVYGLSLLDAKWDKLEPQWKSCILGALVEPDVFDEDVPQHCSNTIWGLAKMDASWSDLPGENLARAYIRCKDNFNCQETSNALYGMAWMDVSWNHLSREFHVALLDAISRTAHTMTIQEVANVMYSLTLITFDAHAYEIKSQRAGDLPVGSGNYGVSNSVDNQNSFSYILQTETQTTMTPEKARAAGPMPYPNIHSKQQESASDATSPVEFVGGIVRAELESEQGASGAKSKESRDRARAVPGVAALIARGSASSGPELLWALHRIILQVFGRISVDNYNKENYDQFAMYFELMRVVKGGDELVQEILGRVPRTSGPCATIPSRLHAHTVNAMIESLNAPYHAHEHMNLRGNEKSPFTLLNEFTGLHGVFPVDAAVYYKDELICLIEIDGEFHYKQLGQTLRRKDNLKEFLYRIHYPDLPLFRIRADQCRVVGTERAGQEMAGWIRTLAVKRDRGVGNTVNRKVTAVAEAVEAGVASKDLKTGGSATAQESFGRMTVAQLKQELRTRRMPVSGAKADLVARLSA